MSLITWLQIPVDNIVVLHYDTDQELGNFEYRMRGGTGYVDAALYSMDDECRAR